MLTRFLLLLFLCVSIQWANAEWARSQSEPLVLRDIPTVRRTPSAELQAPTEVELTGIVIFAGPCRTPVVIWNQEAIWCKLSENASVEAIEGVELGEKVIIRGKAKAGHYSPIVEIEHLERLGREPLPEPLPVAYSEMQEGSLDCQYVSVRGIVKSITTGQLFGEDAIFLRLATIGGEFIFKSNFFPHDLDRLIDAEVSVSGFCHVVLNSRCQLIRMDLMASDSKSLKVLTPARPDPFDIPETPIDKLIEFSPEGAYYQAQHRKRVTGVVTAARSQKYIYLSQGHRNILVESAESFDLQPGDQVECCGFVTKGTCFPYLSDATIRRIGRQPPPEPAQISWSEALQSELLPPGVEFVDHDCRLIELTGKLEGTEHHSGLPFRLFLNSEGALIPVSLEGPIDDEFLSKLTRGSLIKATGICRIHYRSSDNQFFPQPPDRFELLLRSSDDVAVLVPASWWTEDRLWAALSWTLAALAAAFAFVEYLRRTILQREREHHAMHLARHELQLKQSAVIAERERLALDLHDTLEQTLAAAMLYLHKVKVSTSPTLIHKSVNLVEDAIRQSREELRRSIGDLHCRTFQHKTLPESIEEFCEFLIKGSDVEFQVVCLAEIATLDTATTQNLIFLTREAVANAIKHAKPNRIVVEIAERDGHIEISIEDDGVGFDVNQIQAISSARYGISGMQQRAKHIQGSITFSRRDPAGMRVHISAPLPLQSTEIAINSNRLTPHG